MLIGRSDVIWNYAATFLKIAATVLLFPLVLRMMPAETVGVWTIFMTVTSFIGLFDFGFNPSFTRNVSYVFSGVKKLRTYGYNTTLANSGNSIDFGLLKGLIHSMRWFYSRMAFFLFLFLISFGTYYIHTVLQHYTGNHTEAYIAWGLLCAINTYNLYTLYYESLLQGKGLVKRSKQIVIIGQIVYLFFAAVLILIGQGLIAIVAAQASSVVIIRILSYKSFFTEELKQALCIATPCSNQDILKVIYPNAVKVGLTGLGSFAVSRSAIVVGSLYLSLEQIASYGISMQLISIISALAAIYTATYSPQIAQYRVQNNTSAIKDIYLKGQIILITTFIVGGLGLLWLGEWALSIIGSKTILMSQTLIILGLLINFLENNHGIAAGIILMSKNEVPFFRAALWSGGATLVLLLLFLNFTTFCLLGMLLAPGIAQACYQNWKWPFVVQDELNISIRDYLMLFKSTV